MFCFVDDGCVQSGDKEVSAVMEEDVGCHVEEC